MPATVLQYHVIVTVTMPRASRTKNQLSEEDKKKRRREQKKLSIRRARAKMSEADLEGRRRQDRERYRRKKEQGKIKTSLNTTHILELDLMETKVFVPVLRTLHLNAAVMVYNEVGTNMDINSASVHYYRYRAGWVHAL